MCSVGDMKLGVRRNFVKEATGLKVTAYLMYNVLFTLFRTFVCGCTTVTPFFRKPQRYNAQSIVLAIQFFQNLMLPVSAWSEIMCSVSHFCVTFCVDICRSFHNLINLFSTLSSIVLSFYLYIILLTFSSDNGFQPAHADNAGDGQHATSSLPSVSSVFHT